MPTLIKER